MGRLSLLGAGYQPTIAAASLLLDSIGTSATGAYSTRKLRAAYAGSAIRVRRSSDSTEQDIGFTTNDLDTASLLTFTGVGDGFITKWYDQSGNTRDFSQTTAANQPKVVSSGSVITTINGKPSIQWDGSTSKMLGSVWSVLITASAYNVFGQLQITAFGAASTPYQSAILVDTNGNASPLGATSNVSNRTGSGHFDGTAHRWAVVTGAATGTNYIVLGTFDGATISHYRNGGSSPGTAAGGNVASIASAVQMGNSYLSAQFFNGATRDFVFFNSDLSSADKNTLGTNMATDGGETWSSIP